MTRFGSPQPLIRSTGHCYSSGKLLEPGERCIAVLVEQENSDNFLRIDYSITAWEEGNRPPKLFSFWKTRIPLEGKKDKNISIDNDLLLDLLSRLEGDSRSFRISFRYVIALALLRRKKLRYIKSVNDKDGQEVWHFTKVPKGIKEEFVYVVRPLITEEDVEELTESLADVLSGEFEA